MPITPAKQIGTLMPIFALNQKNLLSEAKQFILWLKSTNQTLWQILPIATKNPQEPSPYSSWGFGLDLLTPPKTHHSRTRKLFLDRNPWARDIAIFQTIAKQQKSHKWWTWPQELKSFDHHTILNYQKTYETQFNHNLDQQISDHQLWQQILEFAHTNGIYIIGDLPFYLDHTSPLIWSHQYLFFEADKSTPEWLSGVPGNGMFPRQVWGHPLYNWSDSRLIHLWASRILYHAEIFDYLRLDHSIGFYYYGKMHSIDPSQDEIATNYSRNILPHLAQIAQSHGLSLIAEDLTSFPSNDLTTDLTNLKIPTNRVVTLGYAPDYTDLDSYFLNIDQYPKNTICYTSNHDTATLLDWLSQLPTQLQSNLYVRYHLKNKTLENLTIAIRTGCLQNPSHMTIIPIQDWLLTRDRINKPGEIAQWELHVQIENLIV